MQEPPERPKHNDSIDLSTEVIQAWMNTSESCPEGTIPIRKTTEQDVLRASSVRRFGRKIRRRDTTSSDHEVIHSCSILIPDMHFYVDSIIAQLTLPSRLSKASHRTELSILKL